jgi:hypothetical protein
MTHEQKQVLGGMALAVVLTLLALLGVYFLAESGADTVRLWAPVVSSLAGLSLVYCIATIARKRFFHTEVIEGAAYDGPGSDVAVDKAVLQNTLEQTVLAAVAL